MKHIFIINPIAGKQDSTAEMTEIVTGYAASNDSFEYEIYHTQCPLDATRWVCQYCQQHPGQQLRFYACGGDGTLNEVMSGVMKAKELGIDTSTFQVSCFANGRGNDYIKYYGTQADFQDLDRLVNGTPHAVDVMQVGDRYGINVINIGFDAEVGKTANDVRRWPILGKGNSYTTGIVKGIFTAMRNMMTIHIDGEAFWNGPMLLISLGNGKYYGGKYYCCPFSKNHDGLMEVTLFKTMSIFKFLSLIRDYVTGTHFEREDAQKLIFYRQGTRVELSSKKPFSLCIDGEIIRDIRFEVLNLASALTFVAPKAV